MNDGQDYGQLKMGDILKDFYLKKNFEFVYVGIHCNKDRLYEYGTSGIPDYKGRGNKAQAHSDFVIKELMPWVEANFPAATEKESRFIAGFSLGGLSALDILWEHPTLFSKVGVFSGSFWWRKKEFRDGYDDDKDRIMHQKVRSGSFHEGLSFWFECGTKDEKSDRNNNGIIDSIDDTVDLMNELKLKGYEKVTYLEVEDGEHNFNTWRKVMPNFLDWLLA